METIKISELNRNGQRQFQLPKNEITEENKRAEEWLSIDKFDWLSFEKIFRPVMEFSEAEKSVLGKCLAII